MSQRWHFIPLVNCKYIANYCKLNDFEVGAKRLRKLGRNNFGLGRNDVKLLRNDLGRNGLGAKRPVSVVSGLRCQTANRFRTFQEGGQPNEVYQRSTPRYTGTFGWIICISEIKQFSDSLKTRQKVSRKFITPFTPVGKVLSSPKCFACDVNSISCYCKNVYWFRAWFSLYKPVYVHAISSVWNIPKSPTHSSRPIAKEYSGLDSLDSSLIRTRSYFWFLTSHGAFITSEVAFHAEYVSRGWRKNVYALWEHTCLLM